MAVGLAACLCLIEPIFRQLRSAMGCGSWCVFAFRAFGECFAKLLYHPFAVMTVKKSIPAINSR